MRSFVFKVTVQGASKSYQVEIPTGGQLVQIENLKAIYSGNNYGGVAGSNTIGANYALDLVDMNAYLTVLCPDLIKDLKTEDLFKIDIFDLKELKEAYDNEFVDWVNKWQEALRSLSKTKEDGETKS